MKYVEKRKFLEFDDWLGKKAKILAEDLAKLVLRNMKEAIKEKGSIATGKLLESWSYEIASQSNYVFIVKLLSDAKYWRAVDEGTEEHPAFTPVPALIKWIEAKMVRGAFSSLEKESDIERLAYAIAITHKKRGIKGRQYRDIAIKRFNSRKNIIMYNWTRKYASDA